MSPRLGVPRLGVPRCVCCGTDDDLEQIVVSTDGFPVHACTGCLDEELAGVREIAAILRRVIAECGVGR